MKIDYPEALLHYLWKHKLLFPYPEKLSNGETLKVHHPGTQNDNAGPDFTEAHIEYAGNHWHGNIEIHKKSSDWLTHKHQLDPAYENVILHVVAFHDRDICHRNGELIPCIEIADNIEPSYLDRYQDLLQSNSFIPCENSSKLVSNDVRNTVVHQALYQRLEQKSQSFQSHLTVNQHHWEQSFFYFLCQNFGFKVNAQAMCSLAETLDVSLLAKYKSDLDILEALLLGTSGLLGISTSKHSYVLHLKKEYQHYSKLHQLTRMEAVNWKFSRMRPANFPTIRLAQLAALYHKQDHLFSQVIKHSNYDSLHQLFDVEASPYWNQHYHFGLESDNKVKSLGKTSIDNVLINTVVPFLYTYGKLRDEKSMIQSAMDLLNEIPAENNKIIRSFNKIGWSLTHAGHSQGLLQLKKFHCDMKKCLNCAVGIQCLNRI